MKSLVCLDFNDEICVLTPFGLKENEVINYTVDYGEVHFTMLAAYLKHFTVLGPL